MEKIDEQLYSLSLIEAPIGLHQSVMRKLNYQRVKPILFTTFALLILNFVVVVWHINAKLIDAEFSDMARDFFEVFSFNFSFINVMLGNFFEIVSPALVVSAVLSLAGAIYTGKKISSYQFTKLKL